MTDEPITALCPECGTIIEITDVRTLLLSLHQANECEQTSALIHREAGT